MANKYTKYPNAIDTSDQLPKVIDNVTKVNAEVVNRHREAILAIQNELGTNPSGTYSNVQKRLENLNFFSGGGLDINKRANLYLDPQNSTGRATDTGFATLEHPMLTAAAFSQKFGRAVDMQDTTLHILSAGNVGDPLILDRYFATPKLGTGFYVRGPTPTVIFSGTLTNVINENANANQPLILEVNEPGFDWDTAGPGGTSLIGHRVKMVTGSNPGSICWLAARLSATQAIANRLIKLPSYASPVWASGNQFIVESFILAPDIYIKYAAGAGYAEFHDLAISRHLTCNGRIWFRGCDLGKVDLIYNGGEAIYLDGCKVGGSGQFNGVVISGNGGSVAIEAGLLRIVGIECVKRLYLAGHALNYGTSFAVQNTVIEMYHGGAGFLNWNSGAALTLKTDSKMFLGNNDFLWGTSTGTNTYGLRMFSGSICAYKTLPTIRDTQTSTANGGSNVRDIFLGDTNYFWEDMPQTSLTSFTAFVPGGG